MTRAQTEPRWLLYGVVFVLAVAALLGGCRLQEPEAPGAVVAQRDVQWRNAFASTAPGDTLPYVISWTPGARAQGYQVTTTVTQGTGWSGLLTNTPTTGTSMAFTAIHLAAWDSASFRACVVSTAPGKANSSPRCVDWTIVRGPGVPGTPTVDSSLVLAALIIKPDSVALDSVNVVARSAEFCTYWRALDGKVRLTSGQEARALCQGYYDAEFLPSEHLPGYPVAMAWEPSGMWVGNAFVAVRTPRGELAHTLFAGPFG